MSQKPPLWLDLIVTAWIGLVAVVYYGGYWWPARIGIITAQFIPVYAAMLLLSVCIAALRYRRARL